MAMNTVRRMGSVGTRHIFGLKIHGFSFILWSFICLVKKLEIFKTFTLKRIFVFLLKNYKKANQKQEIVVPTKAITICAIQLIVSVFRTKSQQSSRSIFKQSITKVVGKLRPIFKPKMLKRSINFNLNLNKEGKGQYLAFFGLTLFIYCLVFMLAKI